MVNFPNWEKIILIDDDIIVNLIHKKIFEIIEFKGEVLDFNNGFQAFNHILKQITINPELDLIPALIILDLEMPVLNGWEFLNCFGALDSRVKNKFNIIVTSSSTNAEDINYALELAMVDEYIIKPLTIDIIRRLIGGGKG